MLINKEDSLVLLVDVQEKLYAKVANCDTLALRCAWLLKLARTMGVPILASEQYPQGLGPTIEALALYCELQDRISKVHFSCLQEPNFSKRLKQLNKKQLILIGIEAHVCVLQSALELKAAGFEVFVVVDAVSSRNPEDAKYALKRLKQEGIILVTSEMVFFEWVKQAGTPEFKVLSQTFLQG